MLLLLLVNRLPLGLVGDQPLLPVLQLMLLARCSIEFD